MIIKWKIFIMWRIHRVGLCTSLKNAILSSWIPSWWNHALLQKVCNHFQEETQVPLPQQQVIFSHQDHIQIHQELAIFSVSHDPSCHENPLSNLPYDNPKHRRKNKYLATSQEVAHFEFWAKTIRCERWGICPSMLWKEWPQLLTCEALCSRCTNHNLSLQPTDMERDLLLQEGM